MIRISLVLVLCIVAAVAAAQQGPAARPAAPADCPECPELAMVPPGAFTLGTPPDAREVDLATGESQPLRVKLGRPYYVSAREITFGEFRRFTEASGYSPPAGCLVWMGGQWVFDRERSWRDPGFAQPPADGDPVVCVSWEDARAYAQWLAEKSGRGYRLPSETEWEYVARGGTSFARFWGDDDSHEGTVISLACDYANVYDASAVEAQRFPYPHASCSDGHAFVAPAGVRKPNGFGAYDVIGNVREWLADCYTASYAGRPADGRAWSWQGGCEQRVVRGGSWASRPREARAAARDFEAAGLRQNDLGFRVARDFD